MKLFMLTLIFFSSFSYASVSRNCISVHLKDAIKINKKRRPLYAQMTNGESRVISNRLIQLERLSLIPMGLLDRLSRKYQRKGVPLLCLDFVDMVETPAFSSERVIPEIKYSKIDKLNIKALKNKLYSKLDNLDEFISFVESELEVFNKNLQYNCLTRHLFESLSRSAHLVEFYERKAQEAGLKSPRKLLLKNLKLQIFSLKLFYDLDQKASKFQEEGVQIICKDVPPIHVLDDLPN